MNLERNFVDYELLRFASVWILEPTHIQTHWVFITVGSAGIGIGLQMAVEITLGNRERISYRISYRRRYPLLAFLHHLVYLIF